MERSIATRFPAHVVSIVIAQRVEILSRIILLGSSAIRASVTVLPLLIDVVRGAFFRIVVTMFWIEAKSAMMAMHFQEMVVPVHVVRRVPRLRPHSAVMAGCRRVNPAMMEIFLPVMVVLHFAKQSLSLERARRSTLFS
jgi:hypothetical protein